MSNTDVTLFSPLNLAAMQLPNRLVMAPLTRNRAGAGGIPHALNATYYQQRASAGLIISEAAPISPQAIGYPATPCIYNAAQIAGWKLVTDAVHAQHGRIFLQLWHVGRISHPSLQIDNALPVAPSALKPAGDAFTYTGLQPFVTPRALDTAEIPGLLEDYRKAAENAKQAGFDGVEIHAANGYLIDQFLRDGSNQRTDNYGGTLTNRTRLLLEVADAVIGVWGSERVGVRLSPLNAFNDMYDSNPRQLFSSVVEQLNPLNLAYLHVVEGAINGAEAGAAGPVFDVAELRRLYRGVYMANGGYTKERATAALQSGAADLISFGVAFIANPDLPARFAHDAALNAANSATFYGGDASGYTDYPSL